MRLSHRLEIKRNSASSSKQPTTIAIMRLLHVLLTKHPTSFVSSILSDSFTLHCVLVGIQQVFYLVFYLTPPPFLCAGR